MRKHDSDRLELSTLEMERSDKIGYAGIPLRVFKKAVDLTRPSPARQDAPFHGRGHSNRGRQISVTRHSPFVKRIGEASLPIVSPSLGFD